jgi:hypothetical protein
VTSDQLPKTNNESAIQHLIFWIDPDHDWVSATEICGLAEISRNASPRMV